MKTYMGIWIDTEKALLITLQAGRQTFSRIASAVESNRVKGGARSNVPYGPQDKVSDKKLLARRKHQFQEFFAAVAEKIADIDEVHIMGPGLVKDALEKYVLDNRVIDEENLTTEAVDSMRPRQLAARIRDHFGIPHVWGN